LAEVIMTILGIIGLNICVAYTVSKITAESEAAAIAMQKVRF